MNEVVKAAKTSPLSIWSLILGILSMLCTGLIAGIPAIICGHMARSRIRQSQGALIGNGLALAGLILGYIGSAIMVVGLMGAIIVPRYIDLEANTKQRAIDASISELNGREALIWAEHKISSTNWESDAKVLNDTDYNLGSGYIWSNGPPSVGGRDLSYKGLTITLHRKASSATQPAVWSRER